MKKSLKSSPNKNLKYPFEALKTIITENKSRLKDLMERVSPLYNIFEFTKNLEENKIYLKNIEKERKKGRIKPETYEITRGHYLQNIIDIKNNLKQLRNCAHSYFQELKNCIIELEDHRIVLTTDKMRKNITREEFREELKKIIVQKQVIEEKLAFLQVKIIDYDLNEYGRDN
jgi:hypothetical protein